MQPWPIVSYHPSIFHGEQKKTIRQMYRSEFGSSQIQRWSAKYLNLQYQNKGKNCMKQELHKPQIIHKIQIWVRTVV
jgi:hypothetical protein